jgi:hypothetical protein
MLRGFMGRIHKNNVCASRDGSEVPNFSPDEAADLP